MLLEAETLLSAFRADEDGARKCEGEVGVACTLGRPTGRLLVGGFASCMVRD